MSRVFLIGYDPPIFYKNVKAEASNYRTWQFLDPLIKDGHQVCLCVEKTQNEPAELPEEWRDQLSYHPLPYSKPGWLKELQKAHDEFQPDCVVAANFYPSLFATRLRTSRPLWLDIYGDMITILQAACFRRRSNQGLPTTLHYLRDILRTGDVFSVCGAPQQHMLVGELAMAGRLNYRSFGYEFVRTILPGAPPISIESQKRGALRNQLEISESDFILLWAGGYNTWTDVQTLFKGLEWAMTFDERIHFVSVGANTYEAPDNTYAQLIGLVEKSRFRSRFHLLGWRSWEEMPGYYLDSQTGLNIDALHYETIYGTRTRLVEMAALALPAITSLGSELSYLMEKAGVALGFEIGDWKGLGEKILYWCQNPQARKAASDLALRVARNDFSFFATTLQLREWVKRPQFAPDRKLQSHQEAIELLHRVRSWVRYGIWKLSGADK